MKLDELNKLAVSLDFGNRQIEVGEMVSSEGIIYFRFHDELLRSRLEISPFHLKLTGETLAGPRNPFDGLHGLFFDSLPDGWGRLLTDRALIARGFTPETITPIQRLAIVGNGGMGALVFRPMDELNEPIIGAVDLDNLQRESTKILEGGSSSVVNELVQLGGSSGGARPKVLVQFNPSNGKMIHGIETQPEGYESWIVKFRSSIDSLDSANIEMAYYLMARAAGLEMSESLLIEGDSGEQYFATKRFDRDGPQKFHMHSAAGMLHDDFRYSQLDYGHLMDATFKLEFDVRAYQKVLRQAAFNVYAHNRDDHSKNFAFLMDSNGKWKFAPAYDLTFSASSHGMHSTSVNGESKQPETKDLLELGHHFSIAKPQEILDEVQDAVRQWKKFAKKAGVTGESKNRINDVLKTIH